MSRTVRMWCSVVLVLGMAGSAQAGRWWHHGLPSCRVPDFCEPAPCLVPQWVPEKRIVREVVCKPVEREKTVQVCRRVVETKTVTRQCTTWQPVTEMRTVQYTVRVPEWKEVEQKVPVRVPKVITCQGVRRVCRRVPVTTTRTVCYDAGRWVCTVDHCGRPRKVWCPNIVTKEVPCTTYRLEWEEVPYTYQRTVYETKWETRKVRVCTFRCEVRTKEVPRVRYEPKVVEKQVQVPVFKTVVEERKVKCVEWVPEVVEREVGVMVCRLVLVEPSCDKPAPTQKDQKSHAQQKPAPTQPAPQKPSQGEAVGKKSKDA